ncbi:hypothetical protein CVT25_014830 [Psilocybe cyanescens]|uniref:Uncharacterized protein n=1 Tax=Psilocybe cyanescens TaxID=93625 RepID=A0A409WES0_PSICY|nr:hypothetical protein CVT25_014830 [Psilocybe cyanescens]
MNAYGLLDDDINSLKISITETLTMSVTDKTTTMDNAPEAIGSTSDRIRAIRATQDRATDLSSC